MSLYNMLFGRNPYATILLAMLDLDESKVGRFRDCYTDDGGTVITVYTRNGGGNREQYQDTIDELAKHPNYLRDYDDDFDCTYASIDFSVPDRFKEAVRHIADQTNTETPRQKWDKMLAALESGGKSASADRAKEVGAKILAAIDSGQSGKVSTTEGSVVVIAPKEKDTK